MVNYKIHDDEVSRTSEGSEPDVDAIGAVAC
jgi:hypothetical protein